jgi:hypothetical protein
MEIMLLKLNNDEKGAIMLETMLMKLRRKLRSHQMMLHSPHALYFFLGFTFHEWLLIVHPNSIFYHS